MNGGRGAKGSINDRLISMMYRNRYSLQEQKKKGYTKDTKQQQKEYLQSIQNFDIADGVTSLDDKDKAVVEQVFSNPNGLDSQDPVPFTAEYESKAAAIDGVGSKVASTASLQSDSVSSLHQGSKALSEVDVTTEAFDFDHFDYYEVLYQHAKGIEPKEDLDVEEELDKVEDEETILSELEDFIDDSKKLITDIQEEITSLQDDLQESYTQEQLAELESRYIKLRAKVDKLKAQYDTVKDKYNFEDFSILENLEMLVAIDDYADKSCLEEMEALVDACKEEIEEIDGIVIEEKRSVGLRQDMKEQKKEITKRDTAFHHNKQGVIYLDSLEQQIAEEAKEEAELIAQLEKKLANFSSEVVTVTNVVFHTERIFGSFLRIAAGILTVPFTGRSIFGTLLGAHLINRGVHQLRDSLNPEFVESQEVRYRYQSIEREILNSKDYVNTTYRLIDDSLNQLDLFDEEFKNKFSSYAHLIPEYRELEKKIDELKKRLKKKKEQVETMQKDLDRQYEQNKVKVKRAS